MKKITTIVSVFLCMFLLVGCSNSKTIEGAKEDLKKIEETVKEDVKKTEEFSKEKINEAINYIKENIEKVEDANISKKIYEYATYLEESAKKAGATVEHDVVKYATQAKEYAYNVYTATEEKAEELVKEGLDAIKEQTNKLISGGESLLEEFHNMINGK